MKFFYSILDKSKLFLIIMLSLIAINNSAKSELSVNKIHLNAPKALYVFFNELPVEYKSQLSENKKNVTLLFPNASVSDTLNRIETNDIIRTIRTGTKNDTLEILINTSKRTGYTAVPLPYTKSILIELFSWKEIDKSQNYLREGLLAIEDGLYSFASKQLESAMELGNCDAATHISIIQLYEGKLKTAFKNLLFALNHNSKIPDTYAALSQIFRENDMHKEANKYSDIFTNLSGLNEFPNLSFGEIPSEDSLNREIIDMLMKVNLVSKTKVDSISSEMKKKFENVLNPDDSSEQKENNFLSLFPDWIYDYFIYMTLAFVIIGLLLFLAFIKWKKNQLSLQKEKTISIMPDFNTELKTADKNLSVKSHAAKTYINNENAKRKTPSTTVKEEEIVKPEKKQELKLDEKIDRLAKQIVAAQKERKIETITDKIPEKEEKPLDATEKLALNLKKKKLDTKKENLGNIKNDDSIQKSSVSDTAKELDVEKSIIKTKKNLEKIEKNAKKKAKIEEKFNKK